MAGRGSLTAVERATAMPQKKDPDKRVFTGVYFDRPQHDALRALSDRTRVPLAADKYGVKVAARKSRKR